MSRNLAAVDHVELALAKLPAYLQKQRWQELVTAIAEEIQEADDAIVAVVAQLHLDDATDAMLDRAGAFVGQPRAGLDDDAYRVRINGRIAVMRSLGLLDDLNRVARLVLADSRYAVAVATAPPAAVRMVVTGSDGVDDATAQALVDATRAAVSAGVRVLVETSETTDADTFAFAVPDELPRALDPPADFAAGWDPDVIVVELADGTFTTDLDEGALRVAVARSLYVDLATGNDTTGTGSSGAPYKSIWKALNQWGVNQTIYVKAGWYPVGNSWTGGVPFGGNVNVVGVSDFGTLAPGVVTSSVSEDIDALTWTNLGGGVWSAPLASAPYAVVDVSGTAPTWFAVQASSAAVNGPGKYHHGGGTITVGTLTGATPMGGSSPTVLRILRDAVHNGWVNTALNVTVENVHFEGGGNLRCFFAQHCATLTFIDCQATLSEGEGFGLQTSAAGVTHRVNHVRSTAKWNTNDGIQYTAVGAGTAVRALELDCTATQNGRTGGSNQGSTGHRDAVANPYVAIVRVGGDYTENEAQEVTDVGCLVWMLGCNLDGIDGTGVGYELGDDGQAWLHGVTIANVTDRLETDDAAGVINVYLTDDSGATGPGTVQAYTPGGYALDSTSGKGFSGGPLDSSGGALARVQE